MTLFDFEQNETMYNHIRPILGMEQKNFIKSESSESKILQEMGIVPENRQVRRRVSPDIKVLFF